jgi:hypothetical protein
MNKVEFCNFNKVIKSDAYDKIEEFTEELRQLLIKHNIKKISPHLDNCKIELNIKGIEIIGFEFNEIE